MRLWSVFKPYGTYEEATTDDDLGLGPDAGAAVYLDIYMSGLLVIHLRTDYD